MTVTRKTVAAKLEAYLHHRISLPQLVLWAENAMMGGDFGTRNLKAIRDVVAHVGVADVRAFGLTWEDCEKFFHQLGYDARVEVIEAGRKSTPALVREKPDKPYGTSEFLSSPASPSSALPLLSPVFSPFVLFVYFVVNISAHPCAFAAPSDFPLVSNFRKSGVNPNFTSFFTFICNCLRRSGCRPLALAVYCG